MNFFAICICVIVGVIIYSFIGGAIMLTVTANMLKTKGISAFNEALNENEEAIKVEEEVKQEVIVKEEVSTNANVNTNTQA